MAVHSDDSLSTRVGTQNRTAIAFLVLTWFFISLRVWTRTYVIANFGWDDSTMILAGAIFTVYCACMIFLAANGGGTHISSLQEMNRLIKWTIIGEATYLATVCVLKISLGIFFARIVVLPWQLWTIYVTMVINILSNTAAFVYVLLRCGPDLDVYVFRQLRNECTPRVLDNTIAYQQAAATTLTDLIFAILPIFILWNTHMDIRSKISVGLILSLAGLGIICSILRFRYVEGLTQIEDFFWNATNIAIWSTIEPGAGIVAGCLATLRPFLKGAFNRARSIQSSLSYPKHSRSSNNNSNNSSEPRSAEGSEGQPSVTAARPGAHANANIYPQYDYDLEIKTVLPAISRRNGRGSEECILSAREAEYAGHYAPSQSRESWTLERQRTGSVAQDSVQSSAPTNRTCVGSYDRSVLSTSPEKNYKRDSWV